MWNLVAFLPWQLDYDLLTIFKYFDSIMLKNFCMNLSKSKDNGIIHFLLFKVLQFFL